MLRIREAKASTLLGIEKVYITFSIEDTHEDPLDYKFSLIKSNYEEGGYEPVEDNIQGFEYFDYNVNLQNEDIRYFYKILITNLITGDTCESDIFALDQRTVDEYGIYFNQLYSMYLDCAINNNNLLLLKKKKQGKVCSCFDDIRNTSRSSKCTKCFGSKYEGGYEKPVKVSVCYLSASSEIEKFEVSGISSDKTPIQLWTENYPIIQVGDVLIDDKDNTRYVVMNCQPSIKNKVLIRQTLQIQRVPKTDIIYKFEIRGVE